MNDRLTIASTDAAQLESWVRGRTTPQRLAMRARIVLLAGEGLSSHSIARRLGISPHTALWWRRRYAAHGPSVLLHDAPGRGRKTSLPRDAWTRMRSLLATAPPAGGRWTIRRLADAMGMSRASVHRLMHTNDARHRSEDEP